MYSKCVIILTQGKNKGKKCGEVCKACRHKVIICQWCNKEFNRDTAYCAHSKICSYAIPKIKPKIVIKSTSSQLEDMCDKLQTMEQSIRQLTNLIIANKITAPTVVNNILYQQNISISEFGAFKSLCDKMGTEEATKFMCSLASKPKTMDLFEKVYLDCDPSNYPIANNNGKDFCYRDSDNNIIHDEGGQKIAQLGDRLMKNTFVEAIDPLLTRFVRQNEGDHEGDDGDYDMFHTLQKAACLVKPDRTFIKDLSLKTYNPDHTFFQKEDIY